MVKVQQRGLGRGLSALISENYTQPPAATTATPAATPASAQGDVAVLEAQLPQGTREIHVAKLTPGKFQPRTRFNEEQLRELSESIRRNGIMQPIVVRQLQAASRETYEIIAGERRWRAAQLAGLNAVPVIVRDLTDQQALEIALIENIQRADLSPFEEANGFQRLMEEFGYTQEELSGAVGKSRSHIANLLRLLALPDSVKELVEEGTLSMSHARTLIGLPKQKTEELARHIADRGLSVRQAENLARGGMDVMKQAKPRQTKGGNDGNQKAMRGLDTAQKDPDIISLEETLTSNLGMAVAINDRGEKGEIVISYESLGQLDEILKRLGESDV